MDDIPDFLRRNPPKEQAMSLEANEARKDIAPAAPTKAPRRALKDCYTARITARIPLDMTNGQSLVEAMDAVKGLAAHLPAGTVIECSAGMGKI